MQTHNKGAMIHTKIPERTIRISTINDHIVQKKKSYKMKFTNITVIFETVKVIKSMSNA